MLTKDDLNIVYEDNIPYDLDFVFVCCQRNASKYIKKCIDSIKTQSFNNWAIIAFDDASTDDSFDILKAELTQNNRNPFILIKNEKRYAKLRNFFYAIRFLVNNPHTVIIDLDGDDWLAHANVLNRLQREYANGAEQTIGRCAFYPKKPMSTNVNLSDPRALLPDSNNWLHPRTFKKGLFDMIGIEAFTNNGHWFERATDWTYVPYLIEMSKKTAVIDEVLYIYNIEGSNHFIPYDSPKNVFEQFKYKDFITGRLPTFPKLEQLKEEPLGDVLP